MNELQSLTAKYLAGADDMTEVDVIRFYEINNDDVGAPFRDSRLKDLERRIKGFDRERRMNALKAKEHEELLSSQRKFKEITAGWVSLGAVKLSLHEGNKEAWEYDGVRLYEWGIANRPTVHEMLEDAQRIDKGFRKGLNL